MMKITKKTLLAAGLIGSAAVAHLLYKALKKKKPAIVVDFDGVICDDTFPQMGKPKKGVRKALMVLIKDYEIVIHSVRTAKYWRTPFKWYKWKEQYNAIKGFLDSHNIPYTRIEVEHDKPIAKYYIDDRAIEFTSWENVLKRVGEDNAMIRSHTGVL